MSEYSTMTAAELADELDQITRVPAESAATGWVSMLDEATLAYRTTMPGTQVAQAQQAFSAARAHHMDSLKSHANIDEVTAWTKLQLAAADLAVSLRRLGDHPIALADLLHALGQPPKEA